MTDQELGKFGEDCATKHLRQKGFKIIERNYRFLKEEIDIVAQIDEYLVIVEVKTRQTSEIGEPWRAVTKKKQRHIIRCAHQYVIEKDLNIDVRFDIISIIHNSFGTQLEHIEDAFRT